jgi:hypothetical protein
MLTHRSQYYELLQKCLLVYVDLDPVILFSYFINGTECGSQIIGKLLSSIWRMLCSQHTLLINAFYPCLIYIVPATLNIH